MPSALARLRAWLAELRPLQLTPVTWFLLVCQTAFFIDKARFTIVNSDRSWLETAGQHVDGKLVLMVLAAYPTIILAVQLVHLITCGKRALAAPLVLLLVFFYCVFWGYHWQARVSLDYNLIRENIGDIASSEGFYAVVNRVSPLVWLAVATALATVVMLELWLRLLSRFKRPARPLPAAALTFGLYLGLLWLPNYDELTYLLRTAHEHYFGSYGHESFQARLRRNTHPYVGRFRPLKPWPADATHPHVFLVFAESLAQATVERKAAAGETLMPFFDSLIPKSLYVERFYGNSVQSARGFLATLCSILPSIRRKISTGHPELRLRCLPRLLHERAGYLPLFFTGMTNLEHDKIGPLMRRLGFEVVEAMDRLPAAERRHVWGWGLQDDRLFLRLLGRLDRLERTRRSAGQERRPYFTVVATTSHHISYDKVPRKLRALYPEPTSLRQRYENSVRMADGFLRTLFAQIARRPYLAQSMVIVVGDHSIPAGQHGIYFNEIGHYEETFRTPLLIHWPQGLKPERISGVAYSQLDVAPTLTSLLGVEARTHFTGRVIRPGETRQRPVHLVQPYDGKHLATVLYPHKYVRHVRGDREYLYDLARDPLERHNLAGQPGFEALLTRLRRENLVLGLNQFLIETNRVWPAR